MAANTASIKAAHRVSNRVTRLRRHLPWAAAWLMVSLLLAWVMAQTELTRLQQTFDNEAYTAHRLLDEKMRQIDGLIAARPSVKEVRLGIDARLDQRILQAFPHITAIQRRGSLTDWPDDALRVAEAQSKRLRQPVLANVNLGKGRYQVVMAAEPVSFALLVDVNAMVPWREWPMLHESSPVRVSLEFGNQSVVLQPGVDSPNSASGWHRRFRQPLTASAEAAPAAQVDKADEPLQIQFLAERHMGWSELPWSHMLSASLGVALVLLAARALLRQRHDRYRADGLLRIGQAGQLNTLSELAAGMAQELADPLAAVLDATQSAERWLADDPPDTLAAHAAVRQASDDARHLANVVDRLHHVMQQPDLSGQIERLSLLAAARSALDLLQPQWERLGLSPQLVLSGPEFTVLAAPQALAQVLHNLLINAAQALGQVPAPQRTLTLVLNTVDQRGFLAIQDTGPGIANNVVAQIFEPFFTTRKGALGLGLSLCETLTSGMGGTLTAFNRVPRGAEFCLTLPLAP